MSAKNEWEYYKLRSQLSDTKKTLSARKSYARSKGYDIFGRIDAPMRKNNLPTRAQFRKLPEKDQKLHINRVKMRIEAYQNALNDPLSKLSNVKAIMAELLNRELNRRDITPKTLPNFINNTTRDLMLNQIGSKTEQYNKMMAFSDLMNQIDKDPRFKDWDPDKRERFKDFIRSEVEKGGDDYNPDFLVWEDPTKVFKQLDLFVKAFEEHEKNSNDLAGALAAL